MKTLPEVDAARFTSCITVVSNNGSAYKVARDDDGDYKIEDSAENTTYIGPAAIAAEIAAAINDLLAANEEE